jgi:membrane-associated phospholipid phosphatase
MADANSSRRARSSRIAALAAAAAFLALLAPTPAVYAADSMSVRGALEDVKLYYTAPLRWDEEDWLAFVGTLAAIGAAHQFDQRVRTHFVTPSDAFNGGKSTNSLRDAAPTLLLIGGTWFAAGFYRDSDGYRETWSLAEAAALSAATGEILAYAGGRERPDGTTSPNDWRAGGDSFPSVHTSAAFAVGTVFAESGNEDYRWIRRIIGYGIGAGTAYIRVKDNVHWLSDTVAGAALGIATARFVLNRQEAAANKASVQFQPVKDGWMLSYSKHFN